MFLSLFLVVGLADTGPMRRRQKRQYDLTVKSSSAVVLVAVASIRWPNKERVEEIAKKNTQFRRPDDDSRRSFFWDKSKYPVDGESNFLFRFFCIGSFPALTTFSDCCLL